MSPPEIRIVLGGGQGGRGGVRGEGSVGVGIDPETTPKIYDCLGCTQRDRFWRVRHGIGMSVEV